MYSETQHAFHRQPRWRRKTRNEIPLAITADDGIHGQRHRVEIGVLAAFDHAVREALVLVVVELEQLRRFDHLADGFDTDGRERGDTEPGVEFFRSRTNRRLSPVMKQPLQRRWRQEQRQVNTFAHDLRRHVDGFNAGEDVRNEVALVVGLRISSIGDLVVGGTIDVMKDRSRQPPPGKTPELLHVVALVQVHGRTKRGQKRLLSHLGSEGEVVTMTYIRSRP